MRVDTLEGALLDYWVARAEGYEFVREDFGRIQVVRDGRHRLCHVSEPPMDHDYSPSTIWDQGGPIIEREKITLYGAPDGWAAGINQDFGEVDYDGLGIEQHGDTALVSAMRVYVASKYGEEVPE